VEAQPFASAEDGVDFLAQNFGPLIMLRGYLEQHGAWQAARERMLRLFDPDEPSHYLIVVTRRDPASRGT
jgi:hypothetical protein